MGNVYKDEAGHFTNKENNGGPCKHKRIAGGKYEYSEDGGKTWNAFEKREDYDAYETDEDERFDENNEDDFGFDEDGDEEYNREMTKAQEENARLSEGEDGSELLTENDMEQIKKYAEKYEVPLDGLKQVIEEEAQKLIDNGASVTNAKNDAMESVLDDVVSRGNLESFLKNEPASTDALYRPDEDKGPREVKGPADPDAPAGQVLYNQDDEEFLKDMGANLKNTQYGRQETLDEYYERVKDKHTDDMDDWKAFISTAYAMSPKEVDRYIELKEMQKNEHGLEEKPYNREEKVKEYLKEQGFDDDYINKTLENMKKNMNIGQFWDRFFKDKEEK